jgi:predicted CXXCH cytochrome family protein
MVKAERRSIAWVLAVAALVFLPPARATDYPGGTPHSHFQLPESCPGCHLADREGRPDPARLSPDADAVCFGCHRKRELGRTHPLGHRPADLYGKDRVPGDFLLSDDGRMVCLTCHSAHGPFLSAARAFPGQEPERSGDAEGIRFRTLFLRRSSPDRGAAPLCESCHRVPR